MNLIIVTIILAIAGLLAVRWTLAELTRWRSVFKLPALTELLQAAAIKLKPPETAPAEPMPDEITKLVNQWPDQWAREDNTGHARDLYKVYKDWSKVHQTLLQENKDSY